MGDAGYDLEKSSERSAGAIAQVAPSAATPRRGITLAVIGFNLRPR